MKTLHPQPLRLNIQERTLELLEFYHKNGELADCRYDIMEVLEREYEHVEWNIDEVYETIYQYMIDSLDLEDWDEWTLDTAEEEGRICWVDESFYAEAENPATYVPHGYYTFI